MRQEKRSNIDDRQYFLQREHQKSWNKTRKKDVQSILGIAIDHPDKHEAIDDKIWAKEAQKGKDVLTLLDFHFLTLSTSLF